MKQLGKTIITHLPDANPKGIRHISISYMDIQAQLIPRAYIHQAIRHDELNIPCLYFLLGKDENTIDKVYIGHSESFKDRIKSHQNTTSKEFFQEVLVFYSQSNSLNKADVIYLEHLAIALAINSQQYELSENRVKPNKNNLLPHQRDMVHHFFEDVKVLTEFIGHSLFRPKQQNIEGKQVFYIQARNAKASGIYDGNGFTVLAGGIIDSTHTDSFRTGEKRAEQLISCTELVEDQLMLKKDMVFSSPSAAAQFCVGRNVNGWELWKTKEGETLHQIYRLIEEE